MLMLWTGLALAQPAPDVKTTYTGDGVYSSVAELIGLDAAQACGVETLTPEHAHGCIQDLLGQAQLRLADTDGKIAGLSGTSFLPRDHPYATSPLHALHWFATQEKGPHGAYLMSNARIYQILESIAKYREDPTRWRDTARLWDVCGEDVESYLLAIAGPQGEGSASLSERLRKLNRKGLRERLQEPPAGACPAAKDTGYLYLSLRSENLEVWTISEGGFAPLEQLQGTTFVGDDPWGWFWHTEHLMGPMDDQVTTISLGCDSGNWPPPPGEPSDCVWAIRVEMRIDLIQNHWPPGFVIPFLDNMLESAMIHVYQCLTEVAEQGL